MSSISDHITALEHNEARHNLMLSIMGSQGFSFWGLGIPGECAVQSESGSHRAVVLGDLQQFLAQQLADHDIRLLDPPGVIGPDDTTHWYAERANSYGANFVEVEKQLIWSLRSQPKYPGCSGHARPATIDDLNLMLEWLPVFQAESNPHDPVPANEHIEERVLSGDITLWIDRGDIVSMAGVTRRLKHSASITGVYTPPELRGHGYAGGVTAAAVDRIFAEGRKMVSLYTDADNVAANRCYEKIGFTQVCRSHYWISG